MKNLELNELDVQELSTNELEKIEGGTWWFGTFCASRLIIHQPALSAYYAC